MGRVLWSKERVVTDSALHLSRVSLADVGRISEREHRKWKKTRISEHFQWTKHV